MEQITEVDDLHEAMMRDAPASEAKRRGRPPKQAEPAAPPVKTGTLLTVIVARDWWNEKGERQRAGSEIAVDAGLALRMVEDGIFKVKR